MNSDGSDQTQLTFFSVAQKPDYSPDGQQIVFEQYHNDSRTDILVMNADGSNVTPLLTSGYNGVPDWSPDGSKIAFMSESRAGSDTCHIYTMNPDGSQVTQLTFGDGWLDRSPDWSPDRARIVFFSNRAGGRHIYVMDADGSNLTQLTFSDHYDTGPAWSSDGTRIAFRRRETPSSPTHLFLMDSDGSNIIQLTDSDEREFEPMWSPDSSQIAFQAFVDGNGNIYAVTLDTLTAEFAWLPEPQDEGSPVQFTDQTTTGPNQVADWSWDFAGLGTSAEQNPSFTFVDDGVFPVCLTVSDDNGSSDTVCHDVTVNNVAPTVDAGSDITIDEGDIFSRSGSFSDPGADTWTATVDYGDGSGSQSLTLTSNAFDLNHAYTDNGDYVLEVCVADDDHNVGSDYPIPVAQWTRLTANPYSAANPAWSPDGTRIAYTAKSNSWNRNVWSMSPDGSDKTQLTFFSVAQKPDYSPDGQQIVFEQYHNDSRTDVLVMNADGSNVTSLLTSGYNGQPDWSPDGTKIAFQSESYASSNTRYIYTMNADGSQVTQLTSDGWVSSIPDWSPDGEKIVFQSREAGGPGPHIYVMDTDEISPTRLIQSPYQDWNPVWSPDGTKIAFVRKLNSSSPNHIYVIDSDGSNIIQLTDGENETGPAWSPDGSKIAFQALVDGNRDIYVAALDVPTPGIGCDALVVTAMNVAPTATFNVPTAVNEGDNINLSLTEPLDPSLADSAAGFEYTFDCGDGTGYDGFSISNSVVCPTNDNGSRVVGGQIRDKDGGVTEYTANLVVHNVVPEVDAPIVAPEPSSEGSAATARATFSDPGVDDAPFTCTVNYGDGSGDLTGMVDGDTCIGASHVYADNGSYPVTVSVTDKDGAIGTSVAVLHTVNNVAPMVGSISVPMDPIEVNTEITVSAEFTDPGMLDTHTAIWHWGNDTSSAGTVVETNGSGSVSGSHAYTSPGVFTLHLTVTDKDGEVGESTFQYVVVYDPDGGFVTGGGWIMSPEGAYAPDLSLTGKASFGFVSKYKKGASVPTGETEFQFKVADLNFHSDSYEWLVVAGHKAKYKGTGTINGLGNYGFMLTAIDANLTPSTDVDLFRIKIWDKDTGDAITYDNQTGAADDADPTTAIGGGNIVIHKGEK